MPGKLLRSVLIGLIVGGLLLADAFAASMASVDGDPVR
jgi:hypothetical protein